MPLIIHFWRELFDESLALVVCVKFSILAQLDTSCEHILLQLNLMTVQPYCTLGFDSCDVMKLVD